MDCRLFNKATTMIDVLTGDSSCMNMCWPDVGIVEHAGVLTFVWLPSLSLHAWPEWFRQCNNGCTCIFVWSVCGSVKYHPWSVASPLLSIFCKLLHVQKKAQSHFSFLCLPLSLPALTLGTDSQRTVVEVYPYEMGHPFKNTFHLK